MTRAGYIARYSRSFILPPSAVAPMIKLTSALTASDPFSSLKSADKTFAELYTISVFRVVASRFSACFKIFEKSFIFQSAFLSYFRYNGKSFLTNLISPAR